MSYNLQNFYKSTLSLDWSIGTGNFYVAVKPTISTGWLVISPNNATTREIIKYTSTGTDANGDYVVVSVRGVGGTTEQTHTVGEPIRMNITAEYWDAMNDDIAAIVASGVTNMTTTSMGGGQLATAVEIDALTENSAGGVPLLINPKLLGDAKNIPHAAPGTVGNVMLSNGTDWVGGIPDSDTKKVGVGNVSNTTYENYQILYGTANTVWAWTSTGAPTYSSTHLIVGSAQGANRAMPIDMATGAIYTWANQKIKIIEWTATIVADTATAISYMGFGANTVPMVDAVALNRKGIGFITDTNGAWGIYRSNGTNNTVTSIATPSAGKHTFRIEYNPATPLATFYIDGVSVGTHSVNLPSTGDMGLAFTNGTTSTIISCLSGINIAIQK